MIKQTDYAWAAGFIEADGSFSLRVYQRRFCKKNTKTGIKIRIGKMVQPVIQISQDNPAPIRKLNKLFGYPVMVFSRKVKDSNRSYYRVQFIGRVRLLKILQGIKPFLSQKRRQCDILIEVCNRQGDRGCHHYTKEQWEWFETAKIKVEKLNARRHY